VTRVLKESKLPRLHRDVQVRARVAHAQLGALQVLAELAQSEPGKRRETRHERLVREILKRLVETGLDQLDASILAMRDSIATQVAPPAP
jgi:hypothetical protein